MRIETVEHNRTERILEACDGEVSLLVEAIKVIKKDNEKFLANTKNVTYGYAKRILTEQELIKSLGL